METVEWIASPQVTLETEFGPIEVTFGGQDAEGRDYVSARTDAYINGHEPCMVYRGQEYIGHIFLIDTGGIWVVDGTVSWSKRPQWTDAPPTHRSALNQAVAEAVREFEHEHPEYLQAARYARARQSIYTLTREESQQSEKLRETRKAIRHHARVPEVRISVD